MSFELIFDAINRLTPQLRAGGLVGCESDAVNALRALPSTPFHIAGDLSIANDPADAAAHFDRFWRREKKSIVIKAVYTEMNGFDINPDRWFCSLFAYTEDGGLDDFDWLSDWQSSGFEDYTIRGLEPLQAVYASKAFSDPRNSDAADMASLVVVAKFQRFMQRAADQMTAVRAPLYVTAHDYDYIARLLPNM